MFLPVLDKKLLSPACAPMEVRPEGIGICTENKLVFYNPPLFEIVSLKLLILKIFVLPYVLPTIRIYAPALPFLDLRAPFILPSAIRDDCIHTSHSFIFWNLANGNIRAKSQ